MTTIRTNLGRLRKETTIERRLPFTANKSLGGNWIPKGTWLGVTWGGQLPHEYRKVLYKDLTEDDVYVVFSYLTPIAWCPAGGIWRVPPVRYSVTTSRHQSVIALATRERGEVSEEEWEALITSTA